MYIEFLNYCTVWLWFIRKAETRSWSFKYTVCVRLLLFMYKCTEGCMAWRQLYVINYDLYAYCVYTYKCILIAIESKSFHFLCLSLKQVEILFILCKFPFYRHSHEKSEIDIALWFNIRDLSCVNRTVSQTLSVCHATGGGWFQLPWCYR